ncbi:hypothetical protein MNBD_NITROSPINAE02-1693 [hydrothermal vent metagenome]|uniref:HEAT repeat domain-containing protein n=1 Tax=hydrothermal vent metagenome TaxID=652676 RepID=A0A3B1CHW7_9ZZZZ
MKKIILVAVVALIFISPSGARAGGIVMEYQNLVAVLSGYHNIPEAQYWARLEPESTRASLIKMANDSEVFTVIRARALFALEYYKNDEVSRLIRDVAKSDSIPYMRSSAYGALVRSEGVRALDAFRDGLGDKDTMVRLSAARSLRQVGGARARAILERASLAEKNSTVKSVFEKSLKEMR